MLKSVNFEHPSLADRKNADMQCRSARRPAPARCRLRRCREGILQITRQPPGKILLAQKLHAAGGSLCCARGAAKPGLAR
jgi:hypothetical protein